MSRIVMFDIAMSSTMAPSAVSRAMPFEPSMTQFEIEMLRKPPLDSVPHLMRPLCGAMPSGNFFHVPAMTLPSWVRPCDETGWRWSMFSVARA